MWKALHSLVARVRDRPAGRFARLANPSSTAPRIPILALVVDAQDRKLLADVCDRNQWDLHLNDTCGEAWTALNQLKIPVVLCDRDLPGNEWREVVQRMASSSHRACTILLSRVVDDYLWNEVIGKGGYDVLSKPLREDDVVRSVKLAWSYWNSSTKTSSSARR